MKNVGTFAGEAAKRKAQPARPFFGGIFQRSQPQEPSQQEEAGDDDDDDDDDDNDDDNDK